MDHIDIDKELHFLIADYLSRSSSLQRSATVLTEELKEQSLLGEVTSWNGVSRPATVQDFRGRFGEVAPDQLKRLLLNVLGNNKKAKEFKEPLGTLLLRDSRTLTAGLDSQGSKELNEETWKTLLELRTKKNKIESTLKDIRKRGGSSDDNVFAKKFQVSQEKNLENLETKIRRLEFGLRDYRLESTRRSHNVLSLIMSSQLGERNKQKLIGPARDLGCDRLRIMKKIYGHKAYVFCVNVDKTGQWIVTGSDDSLLKLWNARTGELCQTFRAHAKVICDLSIEGSSRYMASCSADQTVRLWELSSGRHVSVLNSHKGNVNCVEFDSEESLLVSASDDGLCCIWDWERIVQKDEEEIANLVNHNNNNSNPSASRSSATTPVVDAALLAEAGVTSRFLDPKVPIVLPHVFRDLDDNKRLIEVNTISIRPQGGLIATGCENGQAFIWAISKEIPPQCRAATTMPNLVEGNYVDGSGRFVRELTSANSGHYESRASITSIEWSHKGDRVMTGSCQDGTVRVWSWRSYTSTLLVDPAGESSASSSSSTKTDETDPIKSQSDKNSPNFFSQPHAISLAVAEPLYEVNQSSNKRVSKRPIANQYKVPTLDAFTWSGDDRFIITMQSVKRRKNWDQTEFANLVEFFDQRVKIFNSHTGELLFNTCAHRKPAFVLRSHPVDSHLFMTAGHDGRILVWNVRTGKIVKDIQVPSEYGPLTILDGTFTPPGASSSAIVATDVGGRLILIGPEEGSTYNAAYPEQFFFDDYRDQLVYDGNGFAVMSSTQQPHHLSTDRELVDSMDLKYTFPYTTGRSVSVAEQLENRAKRREAVQALEKNILRNEESAMAKLKTKFEQEDAQIVEANNSTKQGKKQQYSSARLPQQRSQQYPQQQSQQGQRRSGPSQAGMLACEREELEMRRRQRQNRERDDDDDICVIDASSSDTDDTDYRAPVAASSSNNDGRVKTREEIKAETMQKIQGIGQHERDGPSGSSSSRRRDGEGSEDNDEWKQGTNERSDVISLDSMDSDNEQARRSSRRSSKARKMYDDYSSSDEDDEDESDYDLVQYRPRPSKRRATRTPKPPAQRQHQSQPQQRRRRQHLEEERNFDRSWLSRTSKETDTLSSYVPQCGDSVVYCVQGHEQYLKKFPLGPSEVPPWENIWWGDNWSVVTCIINEVRYVKPAPPTDRQSLEKIEMEMELSVQQVPSDLMLQGVLPIVDSSLLWRTPNGQGRTIVVRYQPEDDCAEFLLLKERFEAGMRQPSNEGDMIEVPFVDSGNMLRYWSAKLTGVCDYEPSKWEGSPWCSYEIEYCTSDNTGTDRVSCWETKAAALDTVLQVNDDFPDTLATKLANRFEELFQTMECCIAFKNPVDIHTYPEYVTFVELPISLSEIISRLRNGFYRHIQQLEVDVRLIRENCFKFNQEGAAIREQADITVVTLVDIIDTEQSKLVSGGESKLSSSSTSSSATSSSLVQEVGVRTRQRRSFPMSELKEALSNVSDILERQDMHTNLFRLPVSAIKHPQYYQLIEFPLCLSDVRTKLSGGEYFNEDSADSLHRDRAIEVVKAYESDINLIVSNCLSYNVEGSRPHLEGRRLKETLDRQLNLLAQNVFGFDKWDCDRVEVQDLSEVVVEGETSHGQERDDRGRRAEMRRTRFMGKLNESDDDDDDFGNGETRKRQGRGRGRRARDNDDVEYSNSSPSVGMKREASGRSLRSRSSEVKYDYDLEEEEEDEDVLMSRASRTKRHRSSPSTKEVIGSSSIHKNRRVRFESSGTIDNQEDGGDVDEMGTRRSRRSKRPIKYEPEDDDDEEEEEEDMVRQAVHTTERRPSKRARTPEGQEVVNSSSLHNSRGAVVGARARKPMSYREPDTDDDDDDFVDPGEVDDDDDDESYNSAGETSTRKSRRKQSRKAAKVASRATRYSLRR